MIKVSTAFVDVTDIAKEVSKGVYLHRNTTRLMGIVERDGKMYRYTFTRKAGYKGNFASTPNLWLAQKVIPSMSTTDDVYNFAFDLHDWLYSVNGEVTKPMIELTRSECDDFMRGVARESPTMQKSRWARFRCSCADLMVGLFAGGKSHWGNDSYGSMNMATLVLEEI